MNRLPKVFLHYIFIYYMLYIYIYVCVCVCVCVCVFVLNFCYYLHVSAHHMFIDNQAKKKKKNFHFLCNIILFASFHFKYRISLGIISRLRGLHTTSVSFFLSVLQDFFNNHKDPGLYGSN
jgi:hypothetical protein